MDMMRLFFLIRSLEFGGAERQLIELVKGLSKRGFAITVATFYDGGALRPEMEGIAGVPVISLHKRSRWDLVSFLWRLWRIVRKSKPQVVHGYMGVANELCSCVGRLIGARIVWGVRASNKDFSQYDWASRLSFRVGAWLSRSADLIIVNSQAGKKHHSISGYSGKRMVVIRCGVDIERFQPDRRVGKEVRAQWGLSDGEILIGLIGRLDPIKGHSTFLWAAALLAQRRGDVRFVCVGDGPGPYKSKMRALAEELGLAERLIWAGFRDDLEAVYNALDLLTSSSYGEGFPNVVAEAMACGVPCIVTDVGDSACIVGDTGPVVPPKDPEALLNGWKQILALSQLDREALGKASRARIVKEFSVSQLVERTETALKGLLQLRSVD